MPSVARLKEQIMDLMQRIDRMGERIDRMSRPKDETPPELRTMQIKMGELAREMDEVASLPAQVRHYDNRLVAQPDDARVWYLSAPAEGPTSGNWDGEAKRLAEKGLECERAGHPSTARIDAAPATHTPIKGEDWIASLRRRVLSASNNDAK
jgi:hypothetical protein